LEKKQINQNQNEVYSQFLLACEEVMGLDILRLETDEEYRTEFFNNMNMDADNKLSEIVSMINVELPQSKTN